jgi:NAD(P)-dependent dehydrogenase (short-subunit alcohol dehydrogenase family)
MVGRDVGNFASIRPAAGQILAEWPCLDVLVHNAGATFPQRTKTVDGIEATPISLPSVPDRPLQHLFAVGPTPYVDLDRTGRVVP